MPDPRTDFTAEEREFAEASGVGPSCPPLRLLLAAQDGILPAPAQEQVASHMAECELCRMCLEDFATMAPAELTPDAERRIASRLPRRATLPGRLRYAAWACAALLLVGLSILFFRTRSTEPSETQVAAIPATPLRTLPLEMPPPPDGISPELEMRGTPHELPPGKLFQAFQPYLRRDYATAAERFRILAVAYPGSDLPPLYEGVSLLALGRYSESVALLQQAAAKAPADRRDTAEWYSAVALQRAGDEASAREVLRSLCSRTTSSRAGAACEALASGTDGGRAGPEK